MMRLLENWFHFITSCFQQSDKAIIPAEMRSVQCKETGALLY